MLAVIGFVPEDLLGMVVAEPKKADISIIRSVKTAKRSVKISLLYQSPCHFTLGGIAVAGRCEFDRLCPVTSIRASQFNINGLVLLNSATAA